MHTGFEPSGSGLQRPLTKGAGQSIPRGTNDWSARGMSLFSVQEIFVLRYAAYGLATGKI